MSTSDTQGDTRDDGRQGGHAGARAQFTQIGTVSALAFSLLALVTSIYQTRLMQAQTELMQKQSRASVWPYLTISENDTHRAGQESFTWRVDNNGVGPAKIESVVVGLDGKAYKTWRDIFAVLRPDEPFHAAQSSINGMVLPPSLNRETTVEMVKLEDPGRARAFFDAQARFQIDICYCSVYDECWIARKDVRFAQPVARCETGKTEFEE
jgi:hypothetical protein